MENTYHRINVFVKTRKDQWNENDEMFYKYFEDSFLIDCGDKDLEILIGLNDHKESDGIISCLLIPDLIDAHIGHSMELEWDDDDVIYLQTTLRETIKL